MMTKESLKGSTKSGVSGKSKIERKGAPNGEIEGYCGKFNRRRERKWG